MCVGEAGNAISMLCAGQATKNVLMDGSDKPRYQMGHMKHETKGNIFQHIQNVCIYLEQVSWLKGDCVLKLKQNGWWRGR